MHEVDVVIIGAGAAGVAARVGARLVHVSAIGADARSLQLMLDRTRVPSHPPLISARSATIRWHMWVALVPRSEASGQGE
jgi:thioredoxin reductase